jgi:glycosyltransferase involved in cell wall biosynthesis
LVPPRDSKALADALQRLAGDPGLRRRLGEAARGLAVREFGERSVTEKTLTLYRTLLKDATSEQ